MTLEDGALLLAVTVLCLAQFAAGSASCSAHLLAEYEFLRSLISHKETGLGHATTPEDLLLAARTVSVVSKLLFVIVSAVIYYLVIQ